VGTAPVTGGTRAFYARRGSVGADILTILHVPYTAWHLSYVVFGAALAAHLDGLRLGGTVLAFFAGTGIASHALDEWNGRPLRTRVDDRFLMTMAVLGFAVSGVVMLAGVWLVSVWVIAWAVAGFVLAAGYSLEWWGGLLHTEIGFGLAWGAFPVLVGFWAQSLTISPAAIGMALAATILSLVQRSLSTSARFVRRETDDAILNLTLADGTQRRWEQRELLSTWETPLRRLSVAMIVIAVTLLLIRW